MSPVCKDTDLSIEDPTGFLENVFVTFIDKKRKLLYPHFKDNGTFGLKYS